MDSNHQPLSCPITVMNSQPPLGYGSPLKALLVSNTCASPNRTGFFRCRFYFSSRAVANFRLQFQPTRFPRMHLFVLTVNQRLPIRRSTNVTTNNAFRCYWAGYQHPACLVPDSLQNPGHSFQRYTPPRQRGLGVSTAASLTLIGCLLYLPL